MWLYDLITQETSRLVSEEQEEQQQHISESINSCSLTMRACIEKQRIVKLRCETPSLRFHA